MNEKREMCEPPFHAKRTVRFDPWIAGTEGRETLCKTSNELTSVMERTLERSEPLLSLESRRNAMRY